MYFYADTEYEAFSRVVRMCPNLTEISGTNINTDGLRALGRLNGSCLSSISFALIVCKNNDTLDIVIDTLCKGSPNLKRLVCVSPNTSRTDVAVQSIVQYCPHIEALSLKNWYNVTDISMIYLARLSSLREIDLSQCFPTNQCWGPRALEG